MLHFCIQPITLVKEIYFVISYTYVFPGHEEIRFWLLCLSMLLFYFFSITLISRSNQRIFAQQNKSWRWYQLIFFFSGNLFFFSSQIKYILYKLLLFFLNSRLWAIPVKQIIGKISVVLKPSWLSFKRSTVQNSYSAFLTTFCGQISVNEKNICG